MWIAAKDCVGMAIQATNWARGKLTEGGKENSHLEWMWMYEDDREDDEG